jgi:phosphoserine aminotransferase
LLDIPDNYEVLFMHGGGSGEFSAVVFNMVAFWVEKRRKIAERELGKDDGKALQKVKKEIQDGALKLDYLVTGTWSLKASQEAANLLEPLANGGSGNKFINIVTDARTSDEGKFRAIPPEHTWNLTPPDNGGSAFVYYCDNEACFTLLSTPPLGRLMLYLPRGS